MLGIMGKVFLIEMYLALWKLTPVFVGEQLFEKAGLRISV